MSRLIDGVAAGAVGTSLLNAVTYVDIAARGRPSSSVPTESVEEMSRRAGVPLGEGRETAEARKEGIGALMGFATGFGGGAAFALVRPFARGVPWPVAAVITAAAVMVATDAASAALGTTDPRSWGPADWLSDVVPHLAYGAGVVLTFDALER